MSNSVILGAAVGLGLMAASATTVTPLEAQTCIDVDRVALEGVTLLDQAALQAGFRDNLGCIGLEGINALLEQVTFAYIDAGYIASRAYLPEQDLSDGYLTIAVIEGQVQDVQVLENGSPAPSRETTAFPAMQGRPLELRDLEQGLAQINRLRSSEATSQLVPGRQPGDSIVAVAVSQGRPWSLGVSADNRGTPSTGEHNFGLTFGYDNLLGLNDQWTLSYQRSMEPSALAFATDTPVGNSYSLSGSIPYGYWTFGLSLSASDYLIDIPGITGPIESSGQSRTVRLSAERLLSLSEQGRWDAGVALRWSDNENQILGATIDTSSRSLTVLDAYIRHSRTLWDGRLDNTLTLRHGLGLFGAFDDSTAPAGSPTAQYTAVLLDASYQKPWQIGEQTLLLTSRLSAQYSNDNLFGSEQFSTGGFGSVRGTRISLLFGNRGVQLINTLSLPNAWELAENTTLTPYLGLDAGHVFEQSEFGISGGTITSYTIGATFSHGRFNLDATYNEIFSSSRFVTVPEDGVFTIQARMSF